MKQQEDLQKLYLGIATDINFLMTMINLHLIRISVGLSKFIECIKMSTKSEVLIASKIKDLYPRLMNHAVFKTDGNVTLAHDLVQDTIKKVLENKSTWNDINSFVGWSITIMNNRFIDMKRKKTEYQILPKNNSDDDGNEDNDPGLPDQSIDVNTKILFDECMKKLSSKAAEIIYMNLIGNKTTAVIAKILETNQNTVLNWLTKAKVQLRDCIQAD